MAGLDAFSSLDLDDQQSGRGGQEAAGSDGPSFSVVPVDLQLNDLNIAGDQRIVAAAAALSCVLVAFHSGDVIRWWNRGGETSNIEMGRNKSTDITRILLEPKGFHAFIICSSGETWYLNFQSNQAKQMSKLKAQGHIIEAISWDTQSTDVSTRDLICGTMGGHVLHLVVDGGKEKVLRTLFIFEQAGKGLAPGQPRHSIPICGLHRERLVSSADGAERLVLFVAAGCGVYAFIGTSFETLFQKYQGEGSFAKALVYEVPWDSHHGELHVDTPCAGSPSTKVLFWLTGVGVLSATICNPLDPDASPLESPPGLIPFPRGTRVPAMTSNGGNLVASLLPPPPPPAPLSMALTKFHIVFIFEDRWAVVSRITHKVVQQQQWAGSFGALRCLARDAHDGNLWMFSERGVFEVIAEREDQNTWALLMHLEQFDAALQACQKPSEKARVVAAHADWLFKRGKYIESAKKFAEARSVPFEHVALRFLAANCKAALLEYFRCRLKQSHDDKGRKVARALLGVWAVELALANLHDLQLQAAEDKQPATLTLLDAARARLHELLRECANFDVHAQIYHLLQSHGRLEELALFAEARHDFDIVLLHHVSRRDYVSAIKKLAGFQAMGAGETLVLRFAPVLFGAEPQAFVSLLVRPEFVSVDRLGLLPAVYMPGTGTPMHAAEAVRYLEHVIVQLPLAPAQAPATDDPSGWATDTGILNTLTVCYANAAAALEAAPKPTLPAAGAAPLSEDTLLRFFEAQESNPKFDIHFALRVCREKGLARGVVFLYGLMGMHEEAVKCALERGDVKLAKHNASRPTDRRVRKQLWERIVESQAGSGADVQTITALMKESQELTIRDVLPYMADDMKIEGFQKEICETLDSYQSDIVTLKQEMDEHRRALTAFKEELKVAQEREVVVTAQQICEICGRPAVQERFYVFTCRHCFHEACLRDVVVPTLLPDQQARFWALEKERVAHAAASAGAAPGGSGPAMSLAEVEEDLDDILAADCPLCGKLMIKTIQRPFVDADEEAEMEAWAL